MFSDEIESYLMGLGFTYARDVLWDTYVGLQGWYVSADTGDLIQIHVTDRRILYHVLSGSVKYGFDKHYYYDDAEVDLGDFDSFRRFFDSILNEVVDVDRKIDVPDDFMYLFDDD